ncbi:phosphoesterase family protein (macronuclear) [Tetrahymena thermophila SB210]|uniref:Phosphoesterase family protein n=1 Tax=Tetrahymena thermophila (strain SB210) TaxID=312017 RepID=Q22P01_TETTS|nr:phosphoesterase family protein [Tetrahymena thermophila SB210]EAR87010.1 phosphoesterase family protein [Tetrahymena thermophila SB210]|eukprot:XP_001007255.1 phosphoesterase family protein [Tetrahymena thermophila SB210]
MQKLSALILLIFAVSLTAKESPIKHIVVLMMENRSFDHMLGWMTKGGQYGNPNVNGLTGNECNTALNGTQICVAPNAQDCSAYDPGHGPQTTTERVYNCVYQAQNSTSDDPCVNHASLKVPANMQGFVAAAQRGGQDGLTEMSGFLPEEVPIITTLANEFALFDNYFVSYPGCTNPNRMFVHMGTCDGCVQNSQAIGQIKNTTLQEVLEKNGLSWRYYYEDQPIDWFLYIEYFNKNFLNRKKFSNMEQFYKDAQDGTLANYTFINPSETVRPFLNHTKSFGLPNDQHPDHSVKEGERLMKNVYEALRNGPKWNETLFIITYDEHGGFYDHVPPPQEGVPNPDGKVNAEGFNFERLGIRVPTIAISPWIEKGQLVKEPKPWQKPFNTSQFEHSSIISTVMKIFGLEYNFSKRTEWAATFDDLISRTEPRTDCPANLTYIPPPTKAEIERIYSRNVKPTVINAVKRICQEYKPNDSECGKKIKTFRDYVNFLEIEIQYKHSY